MWTQPKIANPLAEYYKIQETYRKVMEVIKSCTHKYHIEPCVRLLENFRVYCAKSNVDPSMYRMFISNLRLNLDFKISRLT